MLQPLLIQLDLVWPVTPKVAGSSSVAPAIWMPAVGAEQDYLLFSGELGRGLVVWGFGYSRRRQTFANVAIAASRVAA
jgi:hypothetical protein